jgi:hypothetical protein
MTAHHYEDLLQVNIYKRWVNFNASNLVDLVRNTRL